MFAFSKTTLLYGNALMVTPFFVVVLILYVTFDYVYKFLLNNELVFKLKGKRREKDKEAEKEEISKFMMNLIFIINQMFNTN